MAKQQVDPGLAGLIYIVLGQRDEQTGVVPVIAQGKVARPMGSNLHLVNFVNPNHMRILENEALMEGLLFRDGKEVEAFMKAIQPPPPPAENPELPPGPDGTDESSDGPVVDADTGEGSVAAEVATD